MNPIAFFSVSSVHYLHASHWPIGKAEMTIRPLITFLLVPLVAPGIASGQTLLRWKLKQGESLHVTIQQETESQVAFSGKSATTRIDLTVELDWLVTAADEREIKLKQTLKTVKLKLQSPEGGVIEYDSAAEARPTVQARDIADSLQPLIGTEIALTMTPRGEIAAAEPANKAAEELLKSEKPGEQPAFSRAHVQQLLKQSLVNLPEKAVALNDEWKATSNLTGAAGNYQQVMTYRLAGLAEQDRKPVAQLEMTAKLKPTTETAPPARLSPGKKPAVGKLRVKSQVQSGTIQFAVDAGRVLQAEQTQKLVTERPYRETTIVVTLSSKQTTSVRDKP
jgi:Family of unknown function (DUF6263)